MIATAARPHRFHKCVPLVISALLRTLAALSAPVLAFTLPNGTPAAIEVFDLAGRWVLRRDVSGLGAGHHVTSLGAGAALAPGMYVMRLSQAGHTVSARGVVVR